MKVREVMTTDDVATVGETDSLAAAARRMTAAGGRHLPVVKDREVVGVLSERDLLAWVAAGHWLDGPTDLVGAAMAKPPVLATADDDIGEAAARMLSHRVGCLPVVVGRKLIGLVTRGDLLGHIVAEMYSPPASRG
jgi:CBS domain-containing protein